MRDLVVLCASLDLLRTGLTFGLLCVCALGRAVVLLGTTIDFLAVAAAGVFSGVIDGVILPPAPAPAPARRTAYGSAVAGLGSSGRRVGRRTVPDINEPVPVEFFKADLFDSPDMADGGRPVDAVDALDAVLGPSDFADCDFTGV